MVLGSISSKYEQTAAKLGAHKLCRKGHAAAPPMKKQCRFTYFGLFNAWTMDRMTLEWCLLSKLFKICGVGKARSPQKNYILRKEGTFLCPYLHTATRNDSNQILHVTKLNEGNFLQNPTRLLTLRWSTRHKIFVTHCI